MKKLLSYIIVFIMLISFNLLDVSARKLQCVCSSDPESDISKGLQFSFSFYVYESDFKKQTSFYVNVNGKALGEKDLLGNFHSFEYKIQNYSEIKGDNNSYYYYKEWKETQKCPKYAIYVRQPAIKDLLEGHQFYISDADSRLAIIEYAKKLKDFPKTPAEAYTGSCKTYIIVDDDPVVSNSNEPSNEPTDPNSNIPTVNSNKTLNDDNTIYFCGSKYADDAVMRNIPADVPRIIRFLYIFLQVLVPIGIVVVSSIDLFKAISAQKEDDIKKGQQTLIKRIIAAVIIFFVFAIVKLVLSVISDNSDSIIDCISCFLENSDEYCIKHVQ